MSNARNLANLLGTGTQITTADIADGAFQANKNLIINGAMQVAQRGTSVTGITATPNYCTVDRFLLSTVVGTLTAEQSTDAPDGFSNSFKISCTTAESTGSLNSGDYIQLQQRIEGQNLQHLAMGTSNAKPMTLSFWVKSNITGTGTVELQQKDNSDRQVTPSYTINSADTWEYKTISIPADTSGLINNDNGMGMWLLFWLQSGSAFTGGTNRTSWTAESNSDRNASNLEFATSTSDYFAITGIQLELGDTATPFEHRSYGDELLRCQRYFEGGTRANSSYTGSAGLIWSQKNDSSDRSFPQMNAEYKVFKRATPTVTIESGQDGTANRISGYSSGTNYTVTSIQSPTQSYVCSFFQTSGGLPDQITVGYYTADAELQKMNITSAQYVQDENENNNSINAVIDEKAMFVPLDPANRHYAEILRQVEAGELTIEEAQ